MPLDDAADCGKPQPTSGKLSREERIEYPADDIGCDPDAGVMNFQSHIPALFNVAAWNGRLDVYVVDILHTRSDENRAGLAFRNRFGAVNHQVHDHLLNLSSICLDAGKSLGQLQSHLHGMRMEV